MRLFGSLSLWRLARGMLGASGELPEASTHEARRREAASSVRRSRAASARGETHQRSNSANGLGVQLRIVHNIILRWTVCLPAAAAIGWLGGCRRSIETQPRPVLTSDWLGELPTAMRAEHVPHVAVAVVRADGTIVDTVLSSGAQAATSDDVFEAASLTKPVFAALVMGLVRDGVIRLDAPLSTYPGWPRMSDPRADAITAAMVLSHSSGLGNDNADSTKRLAFDPGHGWHYSGAGYRYLQQVIEHITRQSLDELLRTRIFAPLGMERTTVVDADRPGFPWFVGHDRAGRPMPPDRFIRPSASTSLRTTARDYARFLRAVMDGGRDGSPLRRADVAAMLDPRVSVDSLLGIRWGLGWALAGPVLFHWGSNPGFKSFVFADRSRHLGLVMLTDGDNGLELAPRLVRAATGHDYAFLRFYLLHPTD